MTATRGLSAGALALALLVGCSRTPPPQAAAPQAPSGVDSAAARAAAARRDSLAAQARADSLARANQEQARADSVRAEVQRQGADTGSGVSPGLAAADAAELADAVHFEYDKADLRPAEQAKLDRKIRLLQAHPRLEIQIAGNCDERGSVEYNLALGERRAAVAKRYLVAHGIAAGRVSVVSYGEERPVDPGHSEEAWAKNRRDDFVATRGAN